MENSIAWDLDGTLRDLLGYLKIYPKTYYEKSDYLVEYLKENPFVYVDALPTEYLSVAVKFKPVFILTTYISLEQMLANELWCYKFFGSDYTIKYVKKPQDKLKWLERNPNGILIDDYPYSYDRVLLIDRDYNREEGITKSLRIKNKDDLYSILKDWRCK